MAQHLSFPHGIHFLDCLKLADNTILNQNVQAQGFVKNKSVVNNWYIELSLEAKSSLLQLVAEADLVDPFQQTWADPTMNYVSSIHDLLSDGFFSLRNRSVTH